jgi:multiple sugar transport system permease protein
MVGPFLLMVSASLQPNLIYLTFPMHLIGPGMGFDNYVSLFSRSLIARWILNSAVITVSITLLQIITCSMSGYAFARGKFYGRDLIFWIFMGTLMIPSTVTIIPLYIVVSTLGWSNTFPGLIIPQATSIFGTFLMRQNFKSIPSEYDDAARIDGANRWQVYLQVLLPLTKPALATLGTLTFLDSWNDFLYPLIVTSNDQMYPLTVGLATMVKRGGNAGFSLAGATVSFVPTFVFFLIMQRYVVRGITLSGLKG